ncbi:MAG TPA: hypothetical protein VLV49_00770 [Terriglobales bacterium]|nr:hypothetical protein [Terriglobales bacterium]
MILLITPSARAQECARALEEATSEPAQVAASLRQAATQLREQEFLAVVVDQSLVEAEPEESDLVLQHIGTAIPVYVNFAISGIERVVRELRAALHRRKREVAVARQAAEQALRNELKDTLTALLLSSEMALRGAELSADAAGRLQTVQELAQSLRGKLGMVD